MRNFYILIQGNKFILDKKSNSLWKNIKRHIKQKR